MVAGRTRELEAPFEIRDPWDGALATDLQRALKVGPRGPSKDDNVVVLCRWRGASVDFPETTISFR